MADPHVVTALVKKRAELAGMIEHTQGELKRLTVELDNVEATLRIFDPDIDLEAIAPRRVPVAHHAFRGETSRILLETLRATTIPLTTAQLTRAVIKARGLDTADKRLTRTMSQRVGAALRHWEKKRGAVRSLSGPGQMNLWELV